MRINNCVNKLWQLFVLLSFVHSSALYDSAISHLYFCSLSCDVVCVCGVFPARCCLHSICWIVFTSIAVFHFPSCVRAIVPRIHGRKYAKPMRWLNINMQHFGIVSDEAPANGSRIESVLATMFTGTRRFGNRSALFRKIMLYCLFAGNWLWVDLMINEWQGRDGTDECYTSGRSRRGSINTSRSMQISFPPE